jgi:hypothetical protein
MTVITEEESYEFQIGDIVTEKPYIIPPDRARWTGVVVAIDRDKYMNHTFSGIFEDMILIQWFKVGYLEQLPASVVELVQKAKEDDSPSATE